MSVAAAEAATTDWKDKKKYLWPLGLVVPLIPFLAFVGYQFFGWTAWLWSGPILVHVIIAGLDFLAGRDQENPPDELVEALENDRYYRWVVFLYLPLQFLGFFGGMAMLAGVNPLVWAADVVNLSEAARGGFWAPLFDPVELTLIGKVGLAASIAWVGGIGINTAHELGHKKESVERWLSKIAFAQSGYGHFYIEHNRGHHVRVATPEDPASSRLGENFWFQFLPRTVIGSLKSAWGIEKKRYARKGTHPFHVGNEVLNAWAMTVVLFGAVLLMFPSWEMVGWLVFQAVYGFSMLEVVNYLEHYGLKRQKVGAAGRERYERVLPRHSWNSNNLVTNLFLYHLQRHSDHHANPTRRYQALRDYEDRAPTLPTGYAGMILLAYVPPLWRWVMDKRVVEHLDGDVGLANIQPGKEEYYLKKFGGTLHEVEVGEDVTAQQFNTEVLAAKCPGCEYVYEVAAGDEHEGWPAGTAWNEIPDDWCCPDCGVREKVDFLPVDPETLKERV